MDRKGSTGSFYAVTLGTFKRGRLKNMTRNRLRVLLPALILSLGGLLVDRALAWKRTPRVVWAGPEAATWEKDPVLAWRNRPDVDLSWDAIEGSPRVRTDGRGWRRGISSPERALAARVLFAGDSTTFCAEASDVETYPSRAEELLGEPVANAGVRGYSTVQSMIASRRWAPLMPNLKIVVYTFCDNDWLENDPDAWGWTRPAAKIAAGKLEILPLGFATQNKASGPDGHDARGCRAWGVAHGSERVLAALLRRWRDELSAHGVKLLVTRFTLECDRNEPLERACLAAGVDYVDPAQVFREPHDYVARHAKGWIDGHANALGCATLARAVEPALLAR